MASGPFFIEGSKLLTPEAFRFVLEGELKRGIRAQSVLTLIMIEATRGWEGMMVPADDGTLEEIAQILREQVRTTDLLGHSERGLLSLVLIGADFEYSRRVVNRIVSRIEHHRFSTVLRIALGAACYPTHAVDSDSLTSHAMSHPVISSCGGVHSPTDQN